MLKSCFKCKRELPRSEFYPHPQMGDGLLGKCKPCTRKDALAVRAKRIDHYRAYDRKRAAEPQRKELSRKRGAKMRNANGGLRMRAWNAAHRAVLKGTLVRPPKCSRCPTTSHIAAHHDDYSKPLEVMWLCPVCHAARHKELNRLRVTAVAYGENLRLVF